MKLVAVRCCVDGDSSIRESIVLAVGGRWLSIVLLREAEAAGATNVMPRHLSSDTTLSQSNSTAKAICIRCIWTLSPTAQRLLLCHSYLRVIFPMRDGKLRSTAHCICWKLPVCHISLCFHEHPSSIVRCINMMRQVYIILCIRQPSRKRPLFRNSHRPELLCLAQLVDQDDCRCEDLLQVSSTGCRKQYENSWTSHQQTCHLPMSTS